MSKWSELYKDLKRKYDDIELGPPATQSQISEVEEALGVKLPNDISELLLEMNGDGELIFSTTEIIERNLSMRELELYMPLDCLLFFGGNIFGDCYGYPITRGDGIHAFSVLCGHTKMIVEHG